MDRLFVLRRTIIYMILMTWVGFTTGPSFAARQTKPEIIQDPTVLASKLLQHGSALHSIGQFDQAIYFFRRSITVHPTAEAHTYLGWSLSHLGRVNEAIAECKKAIHLDPEFGNPYNDIGVYLLEQGKTSEAIPWLRKAMKATRYCCYQFPHFNLGRIYAQQGNLDGAIQEFKKALSFDPQYLPAQKAMKELQNFVPKL